MSRVNNSEAGVYVNRKEEFTGSNLYGVTDLHVGNYPNEDKLYAVFSYGYHFPMYIFSYRHQQWFGNSDRYSPTTSKHQTQARPEADNITWLDTHCIKIVLRYGLTPLAALRVRGELTL